MRATRKAYPPWNEVRRQRPETAEGKLSARKSKFVQNGFAWPNIKQEEKKVEEGRRSDL